MSHCHSAPNPAMRNRLRVLVVAAATLLASCGGGGDAGSAGAAPPADGGSTPAPVAPRVLLAGSTSPAPSVGIDGDYFLDTATGRLYGPKAAGVWPAASLSLVGPAGPAGTPGPVGPAGTNGGASDANPGGRLYSGDAAPAPALGRDGDFYLQTSIQRVIGPKTAGSWPASGVSLIGPVGPAGPAGASGTPGSPGASGASLLGGAGAPSNAVGANGDFYIDTASGALIGPKAGGAWPATGLSLVGPAGAQGPTGPAGPTLVAYDYGVFAPSANGNGSFIMGTTSPGIQTNNSFGVILPVACTTMTLRVVLVGAFTGSYTIALLRRAAATLATQTPTSASCTVSGAGARSCTASAPGAFAAGDMMQVQLTGDADFNLAGNTANIGNFLAASAVCR